MSASTWIFGYGSLVWRPEFPFAAREPAYVVGWARRFWQGSTDHRGLPGAPGRVVTLVPDPGARCWGMAYALRPDLRDGILATLDHREQGGYARHHLEAYRSGGSRLGEVLVYVATEENPNYLGPASLEEVARQVRSSRGPSGENVEYVVRLAEALEGLGAEDPHVRAVAELCR